MRHRFVSAAFQNLCFGYQKPRFCIPLCNVLLLERRSIHFGQTMTSQELATALRPFIFTVHPDRFWMYPKEKSTNEISLKKLNEFLGDQLQSSKGVGTPIANDQNQVVTFYMRNNEQLQNDDSDEIRLKKVDIKLSSRENLNTTVHRILSQCSLSTDYLQKINKLPKISTGSSSKYDPESEAQKMYRKPYSNEFYYDKDLFDQMEGDIAKSKMEANLTDFLKSNYLDALKKINASRPIHIELLRLKEELITDLHLIDLEWNCDWGFTHLRGCLKNLSILGKQYPDDLRKLKGKTIIFSRESGIGLDGQIVLSIEDVRNSWLDLIREIKDDDPFVDALPEAERNLSDLLQNISIMRADNNILIAKKYVKQLKRFAQTIERHRQTESFPAQWPQSLAEFRLIVESDSGPLMLSTTGDFIVPASCPASVFVRFVTENLNKASQTLRRDEQNLCKERRIMDECIVAFGLEALDKDENIIPEQMIEFGERLLSMKDDFRPYLKGLHIRVSMYYSVLHDGQICIPFNFIPRS